MRLTASSVVAVGVMVVAAACTSPADDPTTTQAAPATTPTTVATTTTTSTTAASSTTTTTSTTSTTQPDDPWSVDYPLEADTIEDLPAALTDRIDASEPDPVLAIEGPDAIERWVYEWLGWFSWVNANPGEGVDALDHAVIPGVSSMSRPRPHSWSVTIKANGFSVSPSCPSR